MIQLLALILSLSIGHASSVRNAKYLDPSLNPDTWNANFENKEKDVVKYREEILHHLPVKMGETIADVGAGTGQFESHLSKLVGSQGKIYAIDIAPAFIPYMKERFKKEGLQNVEVIQGKTDSTTLSDNTAHLVLVVDTYHHFDHPKNMLRDFHHTLKTDGHLVIIDFRRGPKASAWVNEHMHLTKEDIIKEITQEGFIYLREEPIPFKESFQLTFRKTKN